MTIGIGAFGPNAGRAVFDALAAAEKVGAGAIGGFVTYAAIGEHGEQLRSETQRGGTSTLFTDGETTGVGPPKSFASARVAGVISSGPDRPAPLAQYVPADPRGGLVTGHRIPPTTGVDGKPMNGDVLERLVAGERAARAVDEVVAANPEGDCGLIAIDMKGGAHCRNTERVLRRPDVGTALRRDEASGAVVAVLHNAIRPWPVLAELVAAVALDTMIGEGEPKGWVTIEAGTLIEMGPENAVHCDPAGVAERVTTTDPAIGERGELGAAIYLASAVYIGGELVGRTTFEPITSIENGRFAVLSGKTSLRMSYR
ncbi:MAG: hypothetical protein OXC01_05885 [Immundisolibacterales bacterium]|nr:hypothetical protein [Immundisolibacterales bacterium]